MKLAMVDPTLCCGFVFRENTHTERRKEKNIAAPPVCVCVKHLFVVGHLPPILSFHPSANGFAIKISISHIYIYIKNTKVVQFVTN
jgi:hypothetical protein